MYNKSARHSAAHAWLLNTLRTVLHAGIGNESVSLRLAQCWFPGLAISNAKI